MRTIQKAIETFTARWRRSKWQLAMAARRGLAADVESSLREWQIATRGQWRVSCAGLWYVLWTYSPRCRHVWIRGKFATSRTAVLSAESMLREECRLCERSY